MDLWTSHSNRGKQIVPSVACDAVGLVLVISYYDFSGSGTTAMAGFLTGVLLMLIGVAGLLVSGKQTVVVDPKDAASLLRIRTASARGNGRLRSETSLAAVSAMSGKV